MKKLLLSLDGTADGKLELDPDDDVATHNWGEQWRTPTVDDFNELRDYCEWSWTSMKGVRGFKVSNKKDASKFIFLPCSGYRSYSGYGDVGIAGCYWLKNAVESNCSEVYEMNFTNGVSYLHTHARYYGRVVRPVYVGAKN